jgi:hypothetical protein
MNLMSCAESSITYVLLGVLDEARNVLRLRLGNIKLSIRRSLTTQISPPHTHHAGITYAKAYFTSVYFSQGIAETGNPLLA